MLTRFVVFAGVVTLALTSCNGGSKKHDLGAEGDLSAQVDMSLHTETGTIGDQTGPSDGGDAPPLSGAQVCIAQHSEIPCAKTDDSGNYTIAVPPQPTTGELDFAVVVTAAGHLGETNLLRWSSPLEYWTTVESLWSDAFAAPWAASAGFTYPANGTAFIEGAVYGATPLASPDRAGATVTLTPASGKVVYYDANGIPDPALTATSNGGAFAFGNVTPGTYTFTVTNGTKTCTDPATDGNNSWPSTTPNSLSLYVAGNTIVQRQSITCQ
jgi:hypothetical protein